MHVAVALFIGEFERNGSEEEVVKRRAFEIGRDDIVERGLTLRGFLEGFLGFVWINDAGCAAEVEIKCAEELNEEPCLHVFLLAEFTQHVVEKQLRIRERVDEWNRKGGRIV